MKHTNKLAAFAYAFLSGIGMLVLTGCEGADPYNLSAPDWIGDKIAEIASKKPSRTLQYEFGTVDDTYLKSKSNEMTLNMGQTLTYDLHEVTAGVYNYQGWVLCVDENEVEKVKLRGDNWENMSASNTGCTSDFNWETFVADMNGSDHYMTITYKADGDIEMVDSITASSGTVYHYSYTKSGFTADNIKVYLSNEAAKISVYKEDISGKSQVAPDMQPVSMVLNNVPDEILVNSNLNEEMKGVTATVTFQDPDDATKTTTQTAPFADLTLSAVPDLSTEGQKTLIAVYNKTSKGNAATKAIIGTAKFTCVDSMEGYAFGSITDAYLGAKSNDMTVADGKTLTYKFKQNTAGNAVYQGFVLCVKQGSDLKVALRQDNWENVAASNEGCTNTYVWDENFATIIKEMNGSTHEMTIKYANGTVTMSDNITTKSGLSWTYGYTKSGFTASSLTMYLSEEATKIRVLSEEVK